MSGPALRNEIIEPSEDGPTDQSMEKSPDQADDASDRTNIIAKVERGQNSAHSDPVQGYVPPSKDENTHRPSDPTRQRDAMTGN